MIHLRGEPLAPDNIAAWTLIYLCQYESGAWDREVSERQIIASTRAKAIETLQRLAVGFSVASIMLIHVRAPQTRAEIEDLDRINQTLQLNQDSAMVVS
jgi:hypothetical protein